MDDELASKLADGLYYLTFDRDMNGFSMEVDELKNLILDIANNKGEIKWTKTN